MQRGFIKHVSMLMLVLFIWQALLSPFTAFGAESLNWVPNGSPYGQEAYQSTQNTTGEGMAEVSRGLLGTCVIGATEYMPADKDVELFKKYVMAAIYSYNNGKVAPGISGGGLPDWLHKSDDEYNESNGDDSLPVNNFQTFGENDNEKKYPHSLNNDDIDEDDQKDGRNNNGKLKGKYLNYRIQQIRSEIIAKDSKLGKLLPEYQAKDLTPDAVIANIPNGCRPDIPVQFISSPGGIAAIFRDPVQWFGGLIGWIIQAPFAALYKATEPITWKYMFFTPHVERGETFNTIAGCSLPGGLDNDSTECDQIGKYGFTDSAITAISNVSPETGSDNAVIAFFLYLRMLMGGFFLLSLVLAAIVYMAKGNESQTFAIRRFIPRLVVATLMLMAAPYIIGMMITASNLLTVAILEQCAGGAADTCGLQNTFNSMLNSVGQAKGSLLVLGVWRSFILILASILMMIAAVMSFLRQLAFSALVALTPLFLFFFLFPNLQPVFQKYARGVLACLLVPPTMAFVVQIGLALNPLFGTNQGYQAGFFEALIGGLMIIITLLGMVFVGRMYFNMAKGSAGGSSILTRTAAAGAGIAGRRNGKAAQFTSNRLRGLAERSQTMDSGGRLKDAARRPRHLQPANTGFRNSAKKTPNQNTRGQQAQVGAPNGAQVKADNVNVNAGAGGTQVAGGTGATTGATGALAAATGSVGKGQGPQAATDNKAAGEKGAKTSAKSGSRLQRAVGAAQRGRLLPESGSGAKGTLKWASTFGVGAAAAGVGAAGKKVGRMTGVSETKAGKTMAKAWAMPAKAAGGIGRGATKFANSKAFQEGKAIASDFSGMGGDPNGVIQRSKNAFSQEDMFESIMSQYQTPAPEHTVDHEAAADFMGGGARDAGRGAKVSEPSQPNPGPNTPDPSVKKDQEEAAWAEHQGQSTNQ